jgi:quinol monooxygenase YgiN
LQLFWNHFCVTAIVHIAAAPCEINLLEAILMIELTRAPFTGEDHPGSISRVHGTIRMIIPPKKRKGALTILRSMIEQTELEPGCINCRLYQDVLAERALMLEETWASEKDMERHLSSDKFLAVLLVVEMASEFPEIRFNVISHSTGIETIEKARAKPDRPDKTNIIRSYQQNEVTNEQS